VRRVAIETKVERSLEATSLIRKRTVVRIKEDSFKFTRSNSGATALPKSHKFVEFAGLLIVNVYVS